MTISINLADGDTVDVWQTLSGVSFQLFGANLLPIGSPATVIDGATEWITAMPLDDGGFSVIWDTKGTAPPVAQDFGSTGTAVGAAYAIAAPPSAPTAFTTLADPDGLAANGLVDATEIVLPDGGYVLAGGTDAAGPSLSGLGGALPNAEEVQQFDSASNPIGSPVVNEPATVSTVEDSQAAVLADGSYVVGDIVTNFSTAQLDIERFSSAGTPLGSVVAATVASGEIVNQSLAIAGLPDGGYVVSWIAENNAPGQGYSQEFTATGGAIGPLNLLGSPSNSYYGRPEIDVFSDGQYVVSWTTPSGAQDATFTEQGSPIAPGTNEQIETAALSYTLPIGPHQLVLTGTASQTVTGNSLGDVITSNDYGSTLIGGTGNDTLIAGHGADVLTGGGGSNVFAFNYLPWNAGQITDFQIGTDTLDLSALLSAAGYTGNNAIADGYVSLVSDGKGDTEVIFHTNGPGTVIPIEITTLDGIAPSELTAANLLGETGSSSSAPPPPSPPPAVVDDSAATYALPSNVQDVVLTGTASQVVIGNSLGDVITSNDYGSTLIGGSGNDTLIAGHGADVLSGGGGSNVFAFNYLPWNAGQITDFHVGTDTLDLSALLSAAGYTGSNAVADGYVNLVSDGKGDTDVIFDTNGPGTTIPIEITTLDGIAPSQLTAANLLGETGSSGSSSSSSSTPPTVVDDSAATYTLPSNVQDVVLTGTASQIVTGNSLNDVITSNDYGSTLIAGSGNDTLSAGHGADVLTGGTGNDTFQFNYLPWNAGHITNFNPSTDVLDLRAILSAAGYTGSNPIADGYLSFISDGAGDTLVSVNPHNPSTPWSFLITTLDHVAPSAIHAGDYLFA